jgi:hypothetical protein
MQGQLKKITVENLSTYVVKDERLPMLMQRLTDSGAKTFLLTNSDWWYTNEVLLLFFNKTENAFSPLPARFKASNADTTACLPLQDCIVHTMAGRPTMHSR